METEWIEWSLYLMPVVLIGLYAVYKHLKQKKAIAMLDAAIAEGLGEPATLHPVIEVHKCIGCGTCVTACPEGNVLGLINGKSHLINPTHCIGHGACKTACPIDAITLVFGTAERGVDIPTVNDRFETNVEGVYIAGELGGMGLIRNAVEQGRQAMDSIIKVKRKTCPLDVVIIGAGPAGFSATLAAQQAGLKYVTIEQESLGGTVFNFPRGKIVMTQPMNLPIIGKIKIRETTKEALLELWQDVERKTGITINYRENMTGLVPVENGFEIKTDKGIYKTSSVLFAIGRRGTPRKLGVKGEELPKVVYRLIDPEQYINKKVLVVGGGDSALEAAISIAEQDGSEVTLSYRSEAFSRAKDKNRKKIESLEKAGQVKVLMKSNVKEINVGSVTIDHQGELLNIKNDGVIISAGGVLPTPMLKEIGIEVETKYGTE